MNQPGVPPGWQPGLSDKDFQRLSQFIYRECGIMMPPSKKTMLSARLQKRLRILGMDSFEAYVDWVLDPQEAGSELIHFIDVVTTNKTEFFREADHFTYLNETAVPELVNTTGAGVKRPLKLWCSASSTGEEPYTLAITLSEFGSAFRGGRFQFEVLATDISTRVLKVAQEGVYELEKVAGVPMALKRKYMMRSKDPSRALVRMTPELRRQVRFQRLNLMDATYHPPGVKMDIIFCRNVIIYFDRPTTQDVINKLCRHLLPGGYLFVGHSETLNTLQVPVKQVAPTIYRLPE